MRKVILAFALLAWTGAGRADIDHSQFQRLTASLLKVEAFNPDGSVSIGSGVAVAKDTVATNCHVTRNAAAIDLVKGARRMSVEAQYSDIERDLCLLYSGAADESATARLHPETLQVGQPVIAVGFIFGIAARINPGEIKALYDFDGAKVIQSSTPFTSGASGGGLFDEQGRLVGIVTFKSRGGVAHHFSIPIKWVVDALAKHAAQPVQPLPGAPFWQRARDAQPFFLQAATLEAEENWFGLADLAERWSAAETINASPWLMRGKAHYRLKQTALAIEAYKKALALDPALADAWYRLGLVYATNGDSGGVRDVHRTLLALDRHLAQEFSKQTQACVSVPSMLC